MDIYMRTYSQSVYGLTKIQREVTTARKFHKTPITVLRTWGTSLSINYLYTDKILKKPALKKNVFMVTLFSKIDGGLHCTKIRYLESSSHYRAG